MGYEIGQALGPGAALPVTLYWQPAGRSVSRRYKYKLLLMSGKEQLSVTDREPNSGCRPTTEWAGGSTIVEYSGVRLPRPLRPGDYFAVQVYDAETLDKLRPEAAAGVNIGGDGETVVLPPLITR